MWITAYLIHFHIKWRQKILFEKKESNIAGKSCLACSLFGKCIALRSRRAPIGILDTQSSWPLYCLFLEDPSLRGKQYSLWQMMWIIARIKFGHSSRLCYRILLEGIVYWDIETIEIFIHKIWNKSQLSFLRNLAWQGWDWWDQRTVKCSVLHACC